MRERLQRSVERRLSKPIPSCLWPFKLYFDMKSESGCVTHLYNLISDLFFVVDIWIIIWFVGCCRFYYLFFSISQKLELVIELHIIYICPFVQLMQIILQFLCVLFIFLFLEGFEYHQQSMILLSPLFRNLYQIFRNRRGPNTDPWGTPLLTWASLNILPSTATHCCQFDRKLCIHTPTLPIIPILLSLFSNAE